MKTVLFVPGFTDDIDSHDYRAVLKAIENKGYKTKFVSIQWKRTTINDWVAQVEKVYAKYESQDTILAGFSYGSMTALLVAAKRNPAELWLFSLSPYFAEDLKGLKQVWLNQIGKKRIAAFEKLRFADIHPKVACPVKLFAGGAESWQLLKRHTQAKAKFTNCHVIIVPKTLHIIDAPKYIDAIKKAI